MNKSIKDIYYMNLAKKQASHSNDPTTKVGCVIVKNNKIIAISNNQILKIKNIKIPTISIASQPWETKYPFAIHAEMAAIFKAKITRCDDATAYVTLHPCNECMKHLLQFGITRVVYDSLDAKRAKEKYISLAIAIAKKCQVKLEQIKYE